MNREQRIVEYTISVSKANLLSFVMIVPIIFFTLLPFSLIWGYNAVSVGKQLLFDNIIIILIAGVVLHEFLHGITWAVFAKRGFKSIKFGVMWSWLTPYCHCKEPLLVKQYAIGGAMPLLLMGILPIGYSFIFGNGFLLAVGILFTWAASGDIISLYMLSKLNGNSLVNDHPDKIGFYVVDECNAND
jgi:hypothetical protein